MSTIELGIDVGNHSTKSKNRSVISGYTVSPVAPTLMENCMFLNGNYYTVKTTPFAYMQDKTEDNRCIYETLFAIAEELIFRFSKDQNTGKLLSPADIQKGISEITHINLGIGLPPQHLTQLRDKTFECYKNFFANPIEYTYNGYNFAFTVTDVKIFAQGHALVFLRKNPELTAKSQILKYMIKTGERNRETNELIDGYTTVRVIDVGGYTYDLIGISDLKPDVDMCATRESGSLKMYEKIRTDIVNIGGPQLENSTIETIIKNPNSRQAMTIDDKYKQIVFDVCNQWAKNEIIGLSRELGVSFSSQPIIFMGGTSILLKEFILKDREILDRYNQGLVEFIDIPNVNAWGYEVGAYQYRMSKRA